MLALHENPARHRNFRPLLFGRERTGRRALAARGLPLRHHEAYRHTVDQEAVGKGECPYLPAEVFELHQAVAGTHHGPAKLSLGVFEHETASERYFPSLHRAAPRLHTGQGIAVILLIEHAPNLSRIQEPDSVQR